MSAPTIRVLLVEDQADEVELEVRELKRAGLLISHRVVDTQERFTEELQRFAPDVILSDFSMPHFDGMAALAIARERAPHVPFIFVSGTIGEEHAIQALKNGASDYVLKTNLLRLPPAVERAVTESRERREQRRIRLELDMARERLTSILNTLQDMPWSADARGERLLFASPAAKSLFGRRAEDFMAEPSLWIELAHPEDRPRDQDSRFFGSLADLEQPSIRRNPPRTADPLRTDDRADPIAAPHLLATCVFAVEGDDLETIGTEDRHV